MSRKAQRVWFQTYKYMEVWVGTRRDWEYFRQEGIFAWGPLDPSQHQIRMKGGQWEISAQTQEGKMWWWPIVDLVEQRRVNRLVRQSYQVGLQEGKEAKQKV